MTRWDPDRLGDSATRVLVAVVCLRRPSVADVARHVGLSKASTYDHLLRLRRRGLVTWDPRGAGTLRPTVAVVAWTPPSPNRRHQRTA